MLMFGYSIITDFYCRLIINVAIIGRRRACLMLLRRFDKQKKWSEQKKILITSRTGKSCSRNQYLAGFYYLHDTTNVQRGDGCNHAEYGKCVRSALPHQFICIVIHYYYFFTIIFCVRLLAPFSGARKVDGDDEYKF